ncbi:MAG TPA: hypothetical protein VGO45_10300 [Bacteroidia bacterium]|jgi:hypothetical protein|nr:hypothetical protein [Bacteroidia bacterium]
MSAHPADFGKYVLVALFASIKFLFSPFFAEGVHLNFKESILSTTAGGIAGILAFGFIGELISDYWAKITAFFLSVFGKRSKEEAARYSRRKFKWMTRFIVKVKSRLGLFGLAFLSPCLISIPLGALACMSFFSHRRKEAFLYLFVSLAFWSVVLNVGAYFFRLSHLFS